LRDRVQTLKEMAERAKIWYAPIEQWDEKAVAKHLRAEGAADVLRAAHVQFESLIDWSPAGIHAAIEQVASERNVGMGKVAQPLRVALTGTQVSPSIEHTVYLAGRGEALRRIDQAIELSIRSP
jgi:glutamyl-tRNA synthetase